MATYVVTGANRGIGLELCRQLRERGEQVVGVCRRESQDLQTLDVTVRSGVDVGDPDSVADLAGKLPAGGVDALINNAGVMSRQSLGEIDAQAIAAMEQQFRVNALAPVLVTQALLERFNQGAKVGIVTSRMGSIADNTSGGHYGYRMSKAAVNMAGVSLAHDLLQRGIAVALLHPGFVRTDMTGHNGQIDPPEAASGLLRRLDELTLETTGGFWHANGERLPW